MTDCPICLLLTSVTPKQWQDDAKECRISKVMTHDLHARNAKAMVSLNQ
jgi:hypothetical protein